MEVKVLGTDCPKCRKLYDSTRRAILESGVHAELNKVERLDEIAGYGVTVLPGLVIRGEVKCAGKIPDVTQISNWLKEAQARE